MIIDKESIHTSDMEKHFNLDFALPFSEAIKELKTSQKRPLRKDTGTYHVLCDLFNGKTIDDYDNVPRDLNDRKINNIPQRVNDLKTKYNIKIENKRREGSNVMTYWIDRGGRV